MKLVVSEKVKHRLIGIAVIISLGAIFAPAMMKKSNQNFENNETVHVRLPPKPSEPKVAVSDEQELFQTIKIASRVEPIPSDMQQIALESTKQASQEQESALPTHEKELAKQPEIAVQDVDPVVSKAIAAAAKDSARDVSKQATAVAAIKKTPVIVAKKSTPARKVVVAKNHVVKRVQVASRKHSHVVARQAYKPMIQSHVYAVQLASFSKLNNAQSLVQQLKNKGYKANYLRVASREGVTYKVYVGHSKRKTDVMRVKNQLASIQLKGFIVTTGVS